MSKVLTDLKEKIGQCGKSRYVIAKESGVSAAQLSRFMTGERGLSLDSVERVAAYLGLELVLRRAAKHRRG